MALERENKSPNNSTRQPEPSRLWGGSRQGNKGDEEAKWGVMRTPWLHSLSRQGGCHICKSNCGWIQSFNGSWRLRLSTKPNKPMPQMPDMAALSAATHSFCCRGWEAKSCPGWQTRSSSQFKATLELVALWGCVQISLQSRKRAGAFAWKCWAE